MAASKSSSPNLDLEADTVIGKANSHFFLDMYDLWRGAVNGLKRTTTLDPRRKLWRKYQPRTRGHVAFWQTETKASV